MRRIQEWVAQKIKPKSDETQPIRLVPKRIYILPAKVGLFYVLIFLVILVISKNYGLTMGYALAFQLVGLGFVAMIKTVSNLWGISLSTQQAPAVFAGEQAHFPIFLENDQALSRPGLQLQAKDNHTMDFDIAPNAQIQLNLPVLASKRGRMPLPRLNLSSNYPLGLFTSWSYPSPAAHCLVYPKPIHLPLPEQANSNSNESGSSLKGTSGDEDFAELRERQPAEPLTHVSWKHVARDPNHDRPLLIKQFSGQTQYSLYLSWEQAKAHPELHNTEQRLSALTGWVLQLESSGCRYGLALPGQTIPPGSGNAHREQCLEALALFSAS